jgi:hypothetical protein
MSAKEKAEELVNKYLMNTPIGFHIDDAKECALIAVDEMIDIRNGLYINEGSIAHQWLLDVKHEIEKL